MNFLLSWNIDKYQFKSPQLGKETLSYHGLEHSITDKNDRNRQDFPIFMKLTKSNTVKNDYKINYK